MEPALPPLIICFGDSLTAGYQIPTPEHPHAQETPYGAFLQAALGSAAQLAVSGICGELTGEMVLRFRKDVLEHSPGYVIILGGTNDLGWNANPAEIMRNLLKMYELAQAERIVPVAITVPSIRVDGEAAGMSGEEWLRGHIDRRLTLNNLIKNYCVSKRIACVDLFTATAEPETLCLASHYSNDGLHLTTEGYQRLADLLYDDVFAPRLGLPHTPRSSAR